MSLRGERGRAGQLAGLLLGALAIAGCSGQSPQPKEYGLGQAASAKPGSIEDFAAGAGDVVHFEVEGAGLSERAQTILRKQVRWLRQNPHFQVIVEGHADERGSRAHNLALGAERAMAVKAFLVGNGVGAARIQTVSYGNERPVAVCDDVSCWAQNRRVRTRLKADTTASD